MNTITRFKTITICCIASSALAGTALAGRAIPFNPDGGPPQSIFGGKIEGWEMIEFTLDGANGGLLGVQPHSDGLEPPLVFAPEPELPPLGDPSSGDLWIEEDGEHFSTGLGLDTIVTRPPSVSAVPAPGSAVLLIGAAGVAATRRRRR